LGRWSFTSSRSTGADRNSRGDHFDWDDAPPNLSVSKMEGFDCCVRSMSFSFRSKREDKETTEETAKCYDKGELP